MFDDQAICRSCNWPIAQKVGRWLTPDQSVTDLPACGGIQGAEHIPVPSTLSTGESIQALRDTPP